MPKLLRTAKSARTTLAARPATTATARSAGCALSTRGSRRSFGHGLTTWCASMPGGAPGTTSTASRSAITNGRFWLSLRDARTSRTWRPSARRRLVQRCSSREGRRQTQARLSNSPATAWQAVLARRSNSLQPSQAATAKRNAKAKVVTALSMPRFVEESNGCC